MQDSNLPPFLGGAINQITNLKLIIIMKKVYYGSFVCNGHSTVSPVYEGTNKKKLIALVRGICIDNTFAGQSYYWSVWDTDVNNPIAEGRRI